MEIVTHQCGRALCVAWVVAGMLEHRRHLVPGEVTGIHVGADDGSGDAGVILQLG